MFHSGKHSYYYKIKAIKLKIGFKGKLWLASMVKRRENVRLHSLTWWSYGRISRPIAACCVSLNLGCRQLSALYYVTMDSGIKGHALTRIVIFSALSLAGLTLRRSLGNLEIMGCVFSRNEALSFRKRRKVSKVQINLNFSQNSWRSRAFLRLFVQTVFIFKKKPLGFVRSMHTPSKFEISATSGTKMFCWQPSD